MQCYDVVCCDKIVGEAFITIEGLYKRIRCKCELPDDNMWRLHVHCGSKIMDLGICIPSEEFAVDKRISSRLFNDDAMYFVIETTKKDIGIRCFAVAEDEPFQNIKNLDNAKFSMAYPKPMICINQGTKNENHPQ